MSARPYPALEARRCSTASTYSTTAFFLLCSASCSGGKYRLQGLDVPSNNAASLPGALGMYGLAIGVSNIGESLPGAVYALLSGLNAATVGIIALAAVQLSEKAITDRITRVLVFLGAAAGMMYNALWYFPLLMFLAGVITVVHDFRWLHGPVKAVTRTLTRRPARPREAMEEEGVEMHGRAAASGTPASSQQTDNNEPRTPRPGRAGLSVAEHGPSAAEDETRVVPEGRRFSMSWKVGLLIIVVFFASFTVIMVLRAVLPGKPLLYSLFANLYLAGTIIFGGGPVVIPLLREYIVAENWVSPRDFLIGLAMIQAFPGPNFNFATYLGALTAINGGYSSAAGAVIAFVGIFSPGLILVHGTMGVWNAVRGWRWVKSAIRGVNAAAVGLVYTAVYRLWRIGHIDRDVQHGTDLGVEPWWVVVTVTSYVGGSWFGLKPPAAIIMGAVMGLVWYGVVST